MFKTLRPKHVVLLAATVVILALLIVAGVTDGALKTVACMDCHGTGALGLCENCGGEGQVRGSLWALLPPVIAIALALITKEVFSSLFVGILTGALLYADFSFVGSMDALIGDGLITAVSDTAGIFIFLVELGIIVALINRGGGSAAFGRWAQTHIKSRVGAMFATFVLGVLIFIDDYFNCLTVGSVMSTVAESHKVLTRIRNCRHSRIGYDCTVFTAENSVGDVFTLLSSVMLEIADKRLFYFKMVKKLQSYSCVLRSYKITFFESSQSSR